MPFRAVQDVDVQVLFLNQVNRRERNAKDRINYLNSSYKDLWTLIVAIQWHVEMIGGKTITILERYVSLYRKSEIYALDWQLRDDIFSCGPAKRQSLCNNLSVTLC
jgi:hypothetical protein